MAIQKDLFENPRIPKPPTYSRDLGWCSNCKEKSVKTKCYDDKEGNRKRVDYCINKGCGYRKSIPFPEQFK